MVDIGEDLLSAPYHWTARETHSLLEQANFLLGQGIGLGNDGNQVDLLVKSPHELDVDWFEPFFQLRLYIVQRSLRVTGRLDKVDTRVNTVINQFEPVDPILLLEVSVESSIDIVHNWFPANCQLLLGTRKAS